MNLQKMKHKTATIYTNYVSFLCGQVKLSYLPIDWNLCHIIKLTFFSKIIDLVD